MFKKSPPPFVHHVFDKTLLPACSFSPTGKKQNSLSIYKTTKGGEDGGETKQKVIATVVSEELNFFSSSIVVDVDFSPANLGGQQRGPFKKIQMFSLYTDTKSLND